MMDSTTTSAVRFEGEPLQQEFWEAFPSLFGSSTEGSEQIAVNCNTSARIDPQPGLQQLGEQAGAAAAMDVDRNPNPNVPQEHQESVQGEVGAASISRVADVRSGLDQNLQRASQGPSVGQSNNSSLEQTTLQPLQFMQHQGQPQGVGVQPNVLTTVRGGHQPQYGGMRNNINPALLQQKYQPQHGVQHSKSGFALQQGPAQEQNRDSHQQGHQVELEGVGVQPNVSTTVRGGHQPQYGGMRNNINSALQQQKYQPQHGVQHNNSGFSLQQASVREQNCDSHQQGHRLQSNGTGQQSTNTSSNFLMEGPSHLENTSPNIHCVRCGNPTCQFLAYQNLIDKPTYWCQNCRIIITVPNLGGALGSATPLSNPYSNSRNMASHMIRKQSPLGTSQPGQIIAGPVGPQHASWCGTVQQSKEMQHIQQQDRQQLMRSNTNVQHQRPPELFIPPNQTRGFGQDQPLQQQGYYQNFEPQVANSFPQQPPQGTPFTKYPAGVGCNQGLMSNGYPSHVRHDSVSDSMRHLGQQHLHTQQPNNMTPSFTDLNEQQSKNQCSGHQPIAKKGRETPQKASKEPAHLIGVDKPCQRCHSTKTRFKFFCNKKIEQPRYQCGDCHKHFTFGGRLYHKKLAKGGLMLQYNLIPSSQKRETKKAKYGSGSSDEEEEQEEPADLVDVIKPCKWCKSSNTRFCRSIGTESQLLEYQCDDCSFFLRYDRTSRQVVQDNLKGAQTSNSSRRRYRLRSDAKQDPGRALKQQP